MKKLFAFLLFALLACGRMAVAYPTATGGTITTNAGYRIHTFKSSGSFVVSGSGSLASDSLIVAGGGGGGVNDNSSSGGGGAGGLISTNPFSLSAATYTVTIGAGGGAGVKGSDSVLGALTATGGGIGGDNAGGDGGSGGGAGGLLSSSGGNGTVGQGKDGGDNYQDGNIDNQASGGGGGAGEVGENGASTYGGDGGDGRYFSQFTTIGGSPIGWFGGGAGGGTYSESFGHLAFGGQGGGGVGGGGNGSGSDDGTAGRANMGGGGGGARVPGTSGAGGSGIVIVRYLILPQKATTPSPTDAAINQATNLTLSWVSGGDTTSYNVYFGISNSMASKGNQSGLTYVPAGVTWNTNYQWRIDSVNAQGTTTGTVWSFGTITILKATDPVPVDNFDGVSLSGTNLQWQGGGGETNFTLWYGLQGAMANVYTGTDTNYATGALVKGKEYFWRVDSENASATVTGDTWSFYSAFFVTAHKIMGVIDNTRLFGSKQGRRVWGK